MQLHLKVLWFLHLTILIGEKYRFAKRILKEDQNIATRSNELI
jgi:hypothetical protein